MSHVFLPKPRCPYVARVPPETEVSLYRTCSSRDRGVLMSHVFLPRPTCPYVARVPPETEVS